MKTAVLMTLTILTVTPGARADGFSATHANGFTLRADQRVLFEQQHPQEYVAAQVLTEPAGFTAVDGNVGLRAELAWTETAAELTWSYALAAPSSGKMTIRIPLPESATVVVVHGTRDKRPKTQTVPPGQRGGKHSFSLPRFLTITMPDGTGFAIDPLPMGVWGLTGAAHDGQDRGMSMALAPDAVTLCFYITPTYQKWRATLRGKLVAYAAPIMYDSVHPWQTANYRYAFERVVKIGFTTAPMPKKAYERRSVTDNSYSAEQGYGWVAGAVGLSVQDTGVTGQVYRDRVEGNAPATFRVDIPPGHYYITLNFGSADADTGPLDVRVNGKQEVSGLRLEEGRFRAVPLWVTTPKDHILVQLQSSAGGRWQINALTVSALGTLNEDYTLTRSWWRFAASTSR